MTIKVIDIDVEIIKKNIKNLHLYVLAPNGDVRVTAPLSTSNESIELFVLSKYGWIRKQQDSFKQQRRQTKRQYISGETFYVWGKQYFLQVDYSSKNTLTLSGDRAILTVRKNSTIEQREKFVIEWYRQQLKSEVEKYLPKWENITGLKCSSWQSKYMTTRWGTCNTGNNKIWLNVQLAKKPIECLEYVILHELVHTKIDNHGDDFIKMMNHYMPNWKDVKDRLNNTVMDYLPEENVGE